MSMIRDDDPAQRGNSTDSRPVPDPTLLTTAQLNAAIGNLEARVNIRLEGMDKATDLRLVEILKIPADTARLIGHLRELLEAMIEEKASNSAIMFQGIDKQFLERDVRTANEKTASASALDAALKAAKELGELTNKATAEAATKTEASFTKQIDAAAAQAAANSKNADARIEEMKERIARVEGDLTAARALIVGAQQEKTDQRLSTGAIMAAAFGVFGVLAAVISIVIAITSNGGG